jgi:hypothetical protein
VGLQLAVGAFGGEDADSLAFVGVLLLIVRLNEVTDPEPRAIFGIEAVASIP